MKPLEGLLVVAIEQAVAAPLCTARLVQAGARVIKIEREEGDFARGYDKAAKGESSYFTWLNQGKESLCLDFKSDEGKSLLWRMIEKADVLVQNLSPGALERSGFSTQELHARNSCLIVCNISGYGMSGEASKLPAYDLLVQAESGLVSVSGSPEGLGRIGVSVCDIGAGMTAYSGVLEAVLKRGITNKGSEISISLFDVAADWMAVPFIYAEYGDGAPGPVGLRHPSIAPYGAFECKDGKLVLISIQNEREWQRLCKEVLEAPEMADNPNYASNTDRVKNRDALESNITDITLQITSEAFCKRLMASRIAFGAVNGADDLRGHPAYRPAQYTTSTGESVELPAQPINWSNPNEKETMRTPAIGEHTDAIIKEFSK